MSSQPVTQPATGYPGYGYSAGYPVQGYAQYGQQPVERQVYTEQVTVPTQQTVMVPQTTYQAKVIQVPQMQQVRVPRQVMEAQVQNYQVPKVEYETHTQQVPKTVMVPQTTYETYQYQTAKPVYETKYRTVRVPKMTYEDVQVPYQEQVYETKQQTIQVPRMTEEIQQYQTYTQQTVQEPVQVMVPQTQTVNTIQQINKVVEYARTPVNEYTVPGPTYTQPVAQQQYTYAQPQQYATYAQPQFSMGSSPSYGGYPQYTGSTNQE